MQPEAAKRARSGPWPHADPGSAALEELGLVEQADLRILADRKLLRPSERAGHTHWFDLPPGPRRVRLLSRHVVPLAHGIGADVRRLGVPVRRIFCRSGGVELVVDAASRMLSDGFHEPRDGVRWTDGDAILPEVLFVAINRPMRLGIELHDIALAYPFRPRRALFIDATTPTPDRDAGSNVALWHMRLLRDLGFDVTFVPEDNWASIARYTDALHAEGIATVSYPRYRGIAAFLRDHGRAFDLAYIHRWEIAERCLPALRAFAIDAPVLFNPADLHFLRLQRAAELNRSRADARRAAAVRERELAVIAQVDCTLTCNTVEHTLLQEALPDARLHYLPWVTEARTGAIPSHARRRDVMFLGGFAHPPNADGVRWFAAEILPRLRVLRPGVRMHVYGSGIPPDTPLTGSDGVEIGGYVPDLGPVFDRHRALVAPLRYGAGFKGKIAEAMAHGLPVIATSLAAEGTGLAAGKTLLVADTPDAFATAVARLDSDAETWKRLSDAGRLHVSETFSPERGRAHISDIIRAIGRTDLLSPA